MTTTTLTGAPAESTPVAAARTLPRAVDTLVRAVRAGLPQAEDMALRTLTLWHAVGRPLALTPRRLSADDAAPLEASGQEGTWLLPAAMAGLRSLQPTEEATYDDLLRLAEEIGGLTPDGDVVQAFHDWLWADGAENFEISLHESFVEMMETATARADDTLVVSSVRGLAAAALGDGVAIRSRDLDLAAVTEMFSDVDVDAATSAHPDGGEACEGLNDDAESLVAWSRAQLDAILAHPRLKEQVEPRRLARRVLAWVAAETNDHTLALLARLLHADDGYERLLADAMEPTLLAETLGLNLTLTAASAVEDLHAIVARLPEPSQARLLGHLLRRADTEVEGMALVRVVVGKIGLPRVLRVLSAHGLQSAASAGLAKALGDAVPQGPALARFLESIDPYAAAALLRAMQPPQLASRAAEVGAAAAAHADVAERSGLLGRLLELDDESAVLAMLRARQGEGFTERALHLIGCRLVDSDAGRRALAALGTDRRVDVRVRLAAIRVASRSDALADELLARWSWSPLEPQDIRNRLKALRQRRDAARAGAGGREGGGA